MYLSALETDEECVEYKSCTNDDMSIFCDRDSRLIYLQVSSDCKKLMCPNVTVCLLYLSVPE
jgi:hypothetical protein